MRGGLGRGSEGSSMDRDSLEDFTAEELLVLATEDIQGQLDNLDIAGEEEDDASCSDTKSLIVTNVDLVVFTEPLAKAEFESRFSVFDPDIIFYYIRTFRRYSSLNFKVCLQILQLVIFPSALHPRQITWPFRMVEKILSVKTKVNIFFT